MKKLIALLFMMALCCVPAHAFEVDVAPYDISFDFVTINGTNTQYPPLVYKDVTYFPMTYEYVRRLGLTNSWHNGAFYLACAKSYENEYTPEPPGPANTAARLQCEVADYPIYVNGRLLDNSAEEYPVLNCGGITYFPLTWRFATEEFGLDISWDGRLGIQSHNETRYIFDKAEDSTAYFFLRIVDFYSSYPQTDKILIFDAATGEVSDGGAKEYDYTRGVRGTSISDRLSVSDGILMLDGQRLSDVSDFVEQSEGAQYYSYDMYGSLHEIGDCRLIDVKFSRIFPMPIMGRGWDKSLWFINSGDGFREVEGIELGSFDVLENILTIGGKSYIEVRNYGAKYLGPETSRLFCITPEGGLEQITDEDHGNIELIGEMYGKPVVRATWKSERRAVSAVNDGFFYVEEDRSLTRLYPYVCSKGEFTYNDHLYLYLEYKKVLLDTATGEEYKIEL